LLEEAVKDYLYMFYPDKNGLCNKTNLDHIWDTTGIKPPEYKEIEVPPSGEDLYYIFWELRGNLDGTITWDTIYYYSEYNDTYLNNEELKILFAMNKTANEWINKKMKEQQKVDSKPKGPRTGPQRRR